jgi:hypothetical protein
MSKSYQHLSRDELRPAQACHKAFRLPPLLDLVEHGLNAGEHRRTIGLVRAVPSRGHALLLPECVVEGFGEVLPPFEAITRSAWLSAPIIESSKFPKFPKFAEIWKYSSCQSYVNYSHAQQCELLHITLIGCANLK